jgi:hypothetical protein
MVWIADLRALAAIVKYLSVVSSPVALAKKAMSSSICKELTK